MTISTVDLALGKEAAGALLEELGLEAYLFALEPRDRGWELRVDCGMETGWQSVTLRVDKDDLLASMHDESARLRLLSLLRERLACKTE